MINRHPRSPVTVRIAARIEATEGDANTPPATAAVSLERGEGRGEERCEEVREDMKVRDEGPTRSKGAERGVHTL